MSNLNHTPGPWTVGSSNVERACLSRGEYVVFPLPEDAEIEANARLITAAPDLLEVLGPMTRLLELIAGHGALSGPAGDEVARLLCKSRDALAKATGGGDE